MKRILVTGATGNIGREVVTQLRGIGCHIRALSRSPQSVNLPQDIEVVRGDLAMPDTLDECLKDVDAVFLVWVAPLAAAATTLPRITSRVEHVVLLTSPHRTPHPFFQQPNSLRSVHAGVEELIATSGVQWTFLRPGVFALNCLGWWASQIRTGDVVRWFHGAAATAPIHESDIAAVAVCTLCDEGHHGKEYVLTGPQSLTQREQVHIIGDVIGRPLRFEELAPESARREMLSMMPASVADMLLTAYAAAVDRPALVTSAVGEITGDPARSFRQWTTEHAGEFLKQS